MSIILFKSSEAKIVIENKIQPFYNIMSPVAVETIFITESLLYTGGMEFERHWCLLGGKGETKRWCRWHYGKCRIDIDISKRLKGKDYCGFCIFNLELTTVHYVFCLVNVRGRFQAVFSLWKSNIKSLVTL